MANARISQLACPGEREPLHTWILCHGWRCLGEAHDIATAFITMGLVCPKQGDAIPEGEKVPAVEALMSPGGATLEMLARLAPQRANEIYNEFDFTHPSEPGVGPMILSYGESVPICEGIDFQPFVRRAEKPARFYHDALERQAILARRDMFKIVRREWYCIANPNLVTIQIHFQV